MLAGVGPADVMGVVDVVASGVAHSFPSLPVVKPASHVHRPVSELHTPLPLQVSSREHTSVQSSPRQPVVQMQSPVMVLQEPLFSQAQLAQLSADVNFPLQLQTCTPLPFGSHVLSPSLRQISCAWATHEPEPFFS
jgi:hypothetical protein